MSICAEKGKKKARKKIRESEWSFEKGLRAKGRSP